MPIPTKWPLSFRFSDQNTACVLQSAPTLLP